MAALSLGRKFSTNLSCSLHRLASLHHRPSVVDFSVVHNFNTNKNSTTNLLLNSVHHVIPVRNYAEQRKSFFNFLNQDRRQELELTALGILNGIYMKAPQTELRTHVGIEDSFGMWFTMVTMHIWLVGTRLAREGNEGKKIFDLMLSMMWDDVEQRIKKFEDEMKRGLKVKTRLRNYYRAVNLEYHLLDEGITGSDADLASSLWSILKMKGQDDVQAWNIEILVHYIRYWTTELDALTLEEMVENPEELIFHFPTIISNQCSSSRSTN